jgi:hypothetical protein
MMTVLFPTGEEILLFVSAFRRVLVDTMLPIQWVFGVILSEVVRS